MVMFLGKEHLTRSETAKIFKSFDEDGTGSIDYGELERLIAKFSLATRGELSDSCLTLRARSARRACRRSTRSSCPSGRGPCCWVSPLMQR